MSEILDEDGVPFWAPNRNKPMPFNLPYHTEVGNRLTAEEFGAYMLLLSYCWMHGRVPNDDRQLAIISYTWDFGVWERVAPAVRAEFILENNFLYHPHLEWARFNGPDFTPSAPANRNLPDWRRLRHIVFKRDNFTCQYCFQVDVRLACDHVIPYSRGGPTELSNLVTACVPCNSSKRDMTPEEWKEWRAVQ